MASIRFLWVLFALAVAPSMSWSADSKQSIPKEIDVFVDAWYTHSDNKHTAQNVRDDAGVVLNLTHGPTLKLVVAMLGDGVHSPYSAKAIKNARIVFDLFGAKGIKKTIVVDGCSVIDLANSTQTKLGGRLKTWLESAALYAIPDCD